jgi:hypothetical protein
VEGLHLLPALYVTESQPWIGSATFAVEVLASSVDLGSQELLQELLLDLLLDHYWCPENQAALQT